MVASPVGSAQSNSTARISQQVPSLRRNLRELEMLGQGVGRGRSFRTGDRHRYGGRKKGARVLPRPRLAQKGLRAGRHRFFVDYASDRKSTRLNSSHLVISYAVFCLKKKKKKKDNTTYTCTYISY